MEKINEVIVPQENVSDDAYTIVDILFKNGAKVQKGDNLLVCEGSKTAFEITAQIDGYITYLKKIGDEVSVGTVIAEITSSVKKQNENTNSTNEEFSFTISNKAKKLAAENNIDLSIFNGQTIVSSQDIQNFIGQKSSKTNIKKFKKTDIAIIGSGGHAKQIYDSIDDIKKVAGIVVFNSSEKSFDGLNILGTMDDLQSLKEAGLKNIIIGFGGLNNPKKRMELAEKLKLNGFSFYTVIHPSAIVETSAKVENGAQIFAGAIVGSRVTIGENAIINSGAIVSHDCSISNNAHITPGAILAGGVKVGENTIVGMGSTIFMNLNISSNIVIENGKDIFQDI